LYSRTTEKLVKYVEHRYDNPSRAIPKPLPNREFRDFVDDWDYKFIQMKTKLLLKVLMAANFLQVSFGSLRVRKMNSCDGIRGKLIFSFF